MKKRNELKINEEDELSLRPRYLKEYIGQQQLKEKLNIYICACKSRNEPLDHILFYGPPGLGKTTLANVIANEMGAKLHVLSGPSIEKIGDLAAILSEIEPMDVLFIDEIHRIPKVVEEALYSVMEDYILTVLISNEDVSKFITIHLPPFTLIGATTRPGNISSPLRERFGIIEKIDFYEVDELKEIIMRTSRVFNYDIDHDAAESIAKRSRGTPRIANNFFRRIRDYSTYQNKKYINMIDVNNMFSLLKIDVFGLNQDDVLYLTILKERYKGGPTGLDTLSYAIGNNKTNLEEVIEPYLLQIGFIEKTNRGRKLTEKGRNYIFPFEK